MVTMPLVPSLLVTAAFLAVAAFTARRVLRQEEPEGRHVLFRLLLVLSVIVGFCSGYGIAGWPMAAGSMATFTVITRRSQRKHWDLSDLRGGPSEKAPGWEPPPRSPIDESLTVAAFAGFLGLWAWVVVAA